MVGEIEGGRYIWRERWLEGEMVGGRDCWRERWVEGDIDWGEMEGKEIEEGRYGGSERGREK